MTEFVSIYSDGDSGTVVTVSAAFAEGIGAKVLDYPAVNAGGRPLAARSKDEAEAQKKAVAEAAKAAEKPAKKAAASSTTNSGNAGNQA